MIHSIYSKIGRITLVGGIDCRYCIMFDCRRRCRVAAIMKDDIIPAAIKINFRNIDSLRSPTNLVYTLVEVVVQPLVYFGLCKLPLCLKSLYLLSAGFRINQPLRRNTKMHKRYNGACKKRHYTKKYFTNNITHCT